MIKNSLKFLLLSGMTIAMASCSEESFVDNNGNTGNTTSGFNTAKVQIGKSLQTRATSLDTWGPLICNDSWEKDLTFSKPSDAIDVTKPNFDKNGKVYIIPETFSGALDLQWLGLNEGAKLYNYGEVSSINSVNYNGKITIYNAGTIENFGPSSGGRHTVYNTGTLYVADYANIGNLYNSGALILERNHNQWWSSDKADIPNEMSIYSKGESATIEMPDGGDFKAAAHIHGTLTVGKGKNLKIQNSETQYICGVLLTDGVLDVTEGNLQTSYIEAKEIKFDGAYLYLLPQAHIVAGKISLINSASGVVATKDSYALVEAKDFYFRNKNSFESSFSSNIYFKVDGTIDIEEILVRDNGQKDNVYSLYNSAEEYLASQNGKELADRLNAGDISGVPECGEPYGTQDPTPEVGPRLVPIGFIETPDHDHNIDKDDPHRPQLSATSIDFADGVFYVSYHMRGGNWAEESYDKDDVEGCIETWTIDNSGNQNRIKLGAYMWTNDFDFNHIILDGDQIITVGHYDNKGAIIGKMTNSFKNYDAQEENAPGYSEEFSFKYLTSAEPLYGDVSNQLIDYKNAGDGNCVIKVGNEYWVATYEGYGRLDSEFQRIKNEDGKVAFTHTPGSSKYLIDNGNDIMVLYLNERPESTATAQSTASIATISKSTYPFFGTNEKLNSFVSPVDGKNVLAWDNGKFYACLGKGGLNVNNDNIYSFGEKNQEPVNGIAFDDRYIYLASGSHLRVLDKSNPENQICSYSIPYMSSNFIKLATIDGETYIAVAFGREGVRIFRLEE